ncbi:hypothetical protein SAMN04487911_11136 [Arenibacter nanhaiticus]|uniref:PAP2 superfamily protein n=1 Tax=Arenibacter nanhaiticus TaxID=558155 RepID=A0A1M6GJA0_9FLAO|nr:hypothetical protein [Arenibacter nanhaiticus]SHJ10045.1 hypothetical protein SAMN04487911_11136 [Arenibacter nanhaiticus]
MQQFSTAISYLLHPLFIPLSGTSAYFIISPKFIPTSFQAATILPIFLLTIIIPILSYILLKHLGIVSSVFMPNLRERKYPLYLNLGLLLLVLLKVIPNHYSVELHYYFLGLVAASFSALFLLFINFKCSMHLMGLGSLLMFLINLSIHFEINIAIAIAIMTLLCGLTATARLYLRAHTAPELIIGFLLGVATQLLTVKFWL